MCRACADDPALATICRDGVPEELRRVYLFRDLSDEQLHAVVASLKPVELQAGRWLYRQGDRADRFFLVRRGQIALFRQSSDGRESIVALVGAGEVFAEGLIYLEEARQDLNARAVGESSLLSFDRQGFRSFLEGSPALCFRLMSTLHRRQQMLLDHIERVTLHDATQRVMAYLLDQVGSGDGPQRVSLAVPKATLASHLSIQPETLSRVLGRLKECHYLREEGASLVIDSGELRAGLECSLCPLRSWGCPGPEHLAGPPVEAEPAAADPGSEARLPS